MQVLTLQSTQRAAINFFKLLVWLDADIVIKIPIRQNTITVMGCSVC
jgi:hypothetical protein